jgi:ferritin-like metal-binding protein YciE
MNTAIQAGADKTMATKVTAAAGTRVTTTPMETARVMAMMITVRATEAITVLKVSEAKTTAATPGVATMAEAATMVILTAKTTVETAMATQEVMVEAASAAIPAEIMETQAATEAIPAVMEEAIHGVMMMKTWMTADFTTTAAPMVMTKTGMTTAVQDPMVQTTAATTVLQDQGAASQPRQVTTGAETVQDLEGVLLLQGQDVQETTVPHLHAIHVNMIKRLKNGSSKPNKPTNKKTKKIMEKPHTSDNNGTSNKKNVVPPAESKANNTAGVTSQISGEKKSDSKPGQSLEDLFESNLRDIYSGEKQLLEALPKVAKAAYSEELQDAFTHHLAQTRKQVERLEKIFNRLGIDKKEEEKCMAMEGLIKECNRTIEEFDESPVRDSALIIGAQKIEHYEIAAYGSLCELADVLGQTGALNLLERTLDEEESTDKDLTEIARDINDEAFESSKNSYRSPSKETQY